MSETKHGYLHWEYDGDESYSTKVLTGKLRIFLIRGSLGTRGKWFFIIDGIITPRPHQQNYEHHISAKIAAEEFYQEILKKELDRFKVDFT